MLAVARIPNAHGARLVPPTIRTALAGLATDARYEGAACQGRDCSGGDRGMNPCDGRPCAAPEPSLYGISRLAGVAKFPSRENIARPSILIQAARLVQELPPRTASGRCPC